MTAKKRSGLMKGAMGAAATGALTKRVDGITQAKKIPNTTGGGPKPQGLAKIAGTISCPGDY